nr:hypothetical protein NQZ09_pgp017 [Fibrocapsa japonica]UTE95099.1 hypothetical protein FjapPt_p017 [Fibrocapsa japonica]
MNVTFRKFFFIKYFLKIINNIDNAWNVNVHTRINSFGQQLIII